MKAKEFDKAFDSGEDVTKFLDFSRARRPEQEQKRVNIDFPVCDDSLAGQGSKASRSSPPVAD